MPNDNRYETYVDDETSEAIEALQQGSEEIPEMWAMSQSEAVRELISFSLDAIERMETTDGEATVQLDEEDAETVAAFREILEESTHDR